MLESITPVVLTWNEAPNVARTLTALEWARQVVVLDSGSSDGTLEMARSFPNTRVLVRPFDCLAVQWNHAVHETGVETEWVLALDADYFLPTAFVSELAALAPTADIDGFSASFRYCVHGKALRGSLYPPVTVLFRRKAARFEQDGHAQRVRLAGQIHRLTQPIMHDDRKSLGRWLDSQDRYMRLEAEKLATTPWRQLRAPDRIRLLSLPAPFLAFVWAAFVKGGVLDGSAGLHYAWQRLVAEALLALHLIDRRRVKAATSTNTAA